MKSSKPRMPPRATTCGPVQLTGKYVNELWDCVKWGMEHPYGDGITIKNDPAGQLRAVRQGGVVSGGGGEVDVSYKNYFRVIDASDSGGRKYSVVDGANPNNGAAGTTDLGRVNKVTRTMTANSTIYLVATYSSAYKLEITEKLPAGSTPPYGYFELATVDADFKITQRWTSGVIYFAARYWI